MNGLERLPDGRWKLRATATCHRTGKRKDAVRTLPPGTTKEVALKELLQLREELRNESPVTKGLRLSVSNYAVQWLEARAKRVRPSVAEHHEQVLADFILPKLGDLYVEAVNRQDVEAWVAWAERLTMKDGRPYSRETILGFWRILVHLLRDAAVDLSLPQDPTYRVRPPNPPAIYRRELRTLSAPEVGALLENVKRFSPDRHAEVYVLAYTGMRGGELYGLKWEDVDEARGKTHIRRSVWRGNEGAPKTNAPREVPLSSHMVTVLRDHRKRLVATQHPGLSSGLVFPADNGVHRLPQSLHKPLALAAHAAGIEIKVTPQVLRRTFNTLMVLAGVDRIVLRSVMGHTSEEMTRRYAGIAIEAKHEALGRLFELTGGQA